MAEGFTNEADYPVREKNSCVVTQKMVKYAPYNWRKEVRALIKINSMADIAHCVRQSRKSQRVSQTVLSQLSNVGLRFLCDVERGKPTVQFEKLLSVLTSLGISLKLEMPPE